MRPRPLVALIAIAIAVLGFAIGGVIARSRTVDTSTVSVTTTPTYRALATPGAVAQAAPPRAADRPATARTAQPTAVPTAPPTVAPAIRPTPAPTQEPTPQATAAATPVASAVAAPTIAAVAASGIVQLREANVRVGTIVWSGSAVAAGTGAVAIDAHKSSVAGAAATPCERQTSLRATILVGVRPQTVDYRETNCAGASSSGTIHIDSFAADNRSFSGSFSSGGVNLGAFTGRLP